MKTCFIFLENLPGSSIVSSLFNGNTDSKEKNSSSRTISNNFRDMSRSCLVTLNEMTRESGKSKTEVISEQEAALYMYANNVSRPITQHGPAPVPPQRSPKTVLSSAKTGAVVDGSTMNPLYNEAGVSGNTNMVRQSSRNSDSNCSGETSTSGVESGGAPEVNLELDSLVEVVDQPPIFGVLRWKGFLPGKPYTAAGIELEDEFSLGTDGTYGHQRFFHCPPKRAMFVYLDRVRRDTRFDESLRFSERTPGEAFGSVDCPDIPGEIPPSLPGRHSYETVCGKRKGIQGHHNSCYLDATLFAMFAGSTAFDSLLYRPKQNSDIDEYSEVQKVLREGIVNPLRKNNFVRADKVMKLRQFLDKLGSVKGLTNEEKDPEEFLNSLFQQTLHAEPLIKLSSGEGSYFFQLFLENSTQMEQATIPTTQQLLQMSFLQSKIKLAEIPSCLILQMPRHGREYRMFNRILPSPVLDITEILKDFPRECVVCGGLASQECPECYPEFNPQYAFCSACFKTSHQHHKRSKHKSVKLEYSLDYHKFYEQQINLLGPENVRIHKEQLQLFAVLCIQTSHYVCFVRSGPNADDPWLFFDSMADREGLQHGYNIPEITLVPEVPNWLSESNKEKLNAIDPKDMPEHMRRLVCDAYMCFYGSADMLLYK